jgi:SAM-dependent methyltransferase
VSRARRPVHLNPPTQYADDRNLAARQRLWDHQDPPFDLVGWVLELAGLGHGDARVVLDAGCGNGRYLAELDRRGVRGAGCDLSLGMLRAAPAGAQVVCADLLRLPHPDDSFDVVLAPHVLYHLPDREAGAHELRRVLAPGGTCIIVTNGPAHVSTLRALVEAAARTPGWEMRSPATHVFSLADGAEQLRAAFDEVTAVRPDGVAPVRVTDPDVVADYVASTADHHRDEIERPWADVVEDVRAAAAAVIAADGAFTTASDTGAFLCR